MVCSLVCPSVWRSFFWSVSRSVGRSVKHSGGNGTYTYWSVRTSVDFCCLEKMNGDSWLRYSFSAKWWCNIETRRIRPTMRPHVDGMFARWLTLICWKAWPQKSDRQIEGLSGLAIWDERGMDALMTGLWWVWMQGRRQGAIFLEAHSPKGPKWLRFWF